MAKLLLKNVYKIYPSRDKKVSIFKRLFSKNKVEAPKDFTAVKDFNLEIDNGEFVVFVGPSGCGKSTTLRMIAGLEDITAGELYMDDKLINNVDPMNRDMAMVFQSYALYPNLTAYGNISFGLKIRKAKLPVVNHQLVNVIKEMAKEDPSLLSEVEKYSSLESVSELLENKDFESQLEELNKKYNLSLTRNDFYKVRHYNRKEINKKVQWAADILGIKELLGRKPSEMSGGQCQRVALGRAIVRGPKVFLLDEPLSNLDAKLRTSMRSEIVKLHQRLNTTFVYVTHDQVEAMTMGTKIVVMKDGVIQQVDKPTDLFNYPCNTFVAGFIGTPQMNFFDVTFECRNGFKDVILTLENGEEIKLDRKKLRKINPLYLDGAKHKCVLGVRAEHLNITEKGFTAFLSLYEILGTTTHLFMHVQGSDKDFIVATDQVGNWRLGDQFKLSFNEQKVHLFDKESGVSILEREIE